MKIKSQGKISKACTNCFDPVFIKFNFAYIVFQDNFNDSHKLAFLKRMFEMSDIAYNALVNRDKKISFEFIDRNVLKINKKIPSEFINRFDEKRFNKWAIMRIYPNNNPIVARVIGVIINKIFYIFYIDIGGNLYNH